MAKLNSKPKTKLALVGSETLLGTELAEVLKNRAPESNLVTFAASGEGNFADAEGEAVYVEPLDAKTMSESQAVLLAGSSEGAQKAYALAKEAGGRPLLIDCSGYLEHLPEARILAPLLQDPDLRERWLVVIAHPAASSLALILKRLARYRGLKQLVVNIFEPASEYGKKGIGELHQQTANLLAFKPLTKELFDAQLSFNLLAQYGEEAPVKLAATESRIERHLATLLAAEQSGVEIPIPSIRLVAAPVFHGYSMSIWCEFETNVTAGEVGEALACAQIEVRAKDEEPPDNVGAANQSGLIAGDIRVDRNNAHAVWFWVVGDNIRLVADEAADLIVNLGDAR